MPYYPKSQIQTNLYANEGELIYLSTKEPYIGHYWKTSKNEFYTGKTPQDQPNIKLIPAPQNPGFSPDTFFTSVFGSINTLGEPIDYPQEFNPSYYFNLEKDINFNASIPEYFPTLPTNKDYEIKEFRRYFCKKTNEILYIEISKNTRDKLISKDNSLLWQLYLPFDIPWKLTGDNRPKIFNINKNIVELISTQLNLPLFSEYLNNDFTKYFR
jgi:hypothetical protein